MKLSSIALASAALFVSTTSFASVVTSSSNIDFLAIDGQSASKSFLKSTNSFNVNDQKPHQVVLRVTEIVKKGSDRTLFESDPIIVTFNGAKDDIVISAPRISTANDAERFKKTHHISVKTVSGQEIPSKQDLLPQEGFLPGANIVENLADYNSSNGKAAVMSFVTSEMPAAIPGFAKTKKGKVVVQGQNIAEQQLQYWFQQADKETQTRFLNWAKSAK